MKIAEMRMTRIFFCGWNGRRIGSEVRERKEEATTK